MLHIALVSSLNLTGFRASPSKLKLDSLTPPLGLLTLASVLVEEKHSVSIIDLNYEIAQRNLSLDENFYDAAVKIIADCRAPIVGFSTMCNSFHVSLSLAERLKQVHPEQLILMGGRR